ncbi:MAG: hypothetical protein ACR2MN_01345 [Acidimicrobiales bacterium]
MIKQSYTTGELAELAAGMRRLLDAIEAGDMTADSGTIARLEGAVAALDALAAGRPPGSADLLG